jgi:hypothetical protein
VYDTAYMPEEHLEVNRVAHPLVRADGALHRNADFALGAAG